MDLKSIASSFIIFAALALNIEFILGNSTSLELHNINILFFAIVFNIISTINKLGETNNIGNLIISSSILSVIQLVVAASLWFYYSQSVTGLTELNIEKIVNVAIGALIFNFLSVIMLIIQTFNLRR
jgi:hypothetical protein